MQKSKDNMQKDMIQICFDVIYFKKQWSDERKNRLKKYIIDIRCDNSFVRFEDISVLCCFVKFLFKSLAI